MFEPDCTVCRLATSNPTLAVTIDRSFSQGWTPHRIHRQLVRALDNEAPSRSAVYRHLVGDGFYVAHTSPDERAQNQRERARQGRELYGAALAAVKASRSRPRGSQRLVEQVASWLLQHGLIPQETFAEAGIDAPGAHHLSDPVYAFPEERSISQGWGSGRWGRR